MRSAENRRRGHDRQRELLGRRPRPGHPGRPAAIAMVTLPPLPLLVAAAACGLMYGSIQPVVNLAVQMRTPPGLRCRIIALLVAAEYAAGPVGYLVAGPAVDSFGV